MHLCLSATVRSVKINDWVETVMDRCVHNCVHIEYGHGRSRECTEFRCSPQVLYNTVYNSTTVQQYNSTTVQQPVHAMIPTSAECCWTVYNNCISRLLSVEQYTVVYPATCELHPYNNRRTSLKISTHSHIYINLCTWFWNTIKICYSSIIYFSLKLMCDSVMLVIYFGLRP